MGKLEVEIANLLANVELTIGKLYSLYARKFPEHKEFWNCLVEEEKNHSSLAKSLITCCREGHVRLNPNKCNKDAVATVLRFVKERIDLAKRHAVPLRDVLFTALQIEKNVIENNFYSFFEGESDEFRKVCDIINWETLQHRNRIQELSNSIEN